MQFVDCGLEFGMQIKSLDTLRAQGTRPIVLIFRLGMPTGSETLLKNYIFPLKLHFYDEKQLNARCKALKILILDLASCVQPVFGIKMEF